MSVHHRRDGKEHRVLIECDDALCGAAVAGVGGNDIEATADADDRAGAAGWTTDTDADHDYCPAHKEA